MNFLTKLWENWDNISFSAQLQNNAAFVKFADDSHAGNVRQQIIRWHQNVVSVVVSMILFKISIGETLFI